MPPPVHECLKIAFRPTIFVFRAIFESNAGPASCNVRLRPQEEMAFAHAMPRHSTEDPQNVYSTTTPPTEPYSRADRTSPRTTCQPRTARADDQPCQKSVITLLNPPHPRYRRCLYWQWHSTDAGRTHQKSLLKTDVGNFPKFTLYSQRWPRRLIPAYKFHALACIETGY